MYLKKYQEETNLRCQIVIDTSGSMYFKGDENSLSKLEFSVYAAASLIELLRKQRDAASINFINEGIELQTECKTSLTHINRLYNQLDTLISQTGSTNKKTDLSTNLHLLAEAFHKRSLVILFTDLFEENKEISAFETALQHLKHKGHEVIIFNVTNKKFEETFEFENRPYTFVDMESGAKVKLNPKQVQELYIEKMDAFMKQIRLTCVQYKADLIEADTQEGFEKVLAAYLHKRKKIV